MLAAAAEGYNAYRIARGGYAAVNAYRKRTYAEAILEGAGAADAYRGYKRAKAARGEV